jgi:type IV pilus assembly protein PilV
MIRTQNLRKRVRLPSRSPLVRPSGFSLIEVMVTMVILSFGLLGVAGLLVNGVSNTVALSATSQYLTQYSDSPPASPSSIAENDKKVWLEALAAQLPQGDGQITNSVSGTERKVVIQVRWSNCLGTLSDADLTACTDNSGAAFKTVTFELRL